APGGHAGRRGGAGLGIKIVGERAMAAQMALGIDGAGKKIFAGEIDLAPRRRQKCVAAHGGDLAVENRDAACDGAGGRDDQAVFENNVRRRISHVLNPLDFPPIYLRASARKLRSMAPSTGGGAFCRPKSFQFSATLRAPCRSMPPSRGMVFWVFM